MAAAKDLEAKMGKITDADKAWMERHSSMPRIIGSLIHAMVHTRPDIAYAVSLLSRSMAKPEPYHYKACKHVLLYLRSTIEKCLIYRQGQMKQAAPHLPGAAAEVRVMDRAHSRRIGHF